MQKSFLLEGLKVKSVFVLISLCSIGTAEIQTYFDYPSAQGNGIFILNKRGDLLQISRPRLRNQGYKSATGKLDFVTRCNSRYFFLN